MIEARTYQKISKEDIRSLCIEKRYYECGDIQAYENLLNYVGELGEIRADKVSTEILVIAEDIYKHSDIERFQKEYGASKEDVFNSIYFEVGRKVQFFCESKISEV